MDKQDVEKSYAALPCVNQYQNQAPDALIFIEGACSNALMASP